MYILHMYTCKTLYMHMNCTYMNRLILYIQLYIVHVLTHLICTNQKYLLFRITLLIEHLENRVKPVVSVDKHSVRPKAVPFN